jgi:hypothetical protein
VKNEILPHDQILIREFAIEGIVKGYSNDELIELIVKDYKKYSIEAVQSLVRGAMFRIREAALIDIDKIIPIHIALYEKIYKEMDELYFVPGKLRALRQKEAIVGLHKEQNTVDVYNEVNVEMEQDPQYNINKLDKKEQKRLDELLKKIGGHNVS